MVPVHNEQCMPPIWARTLRMPESPVVSSLHG